MYINILDIITCMDLEGKVYFDVNRYELVYDEFDDKSKYLDLLVIPTVSENVILDLYSEKKSKEKGYSVFRNKKLNIEDFYIIINKNNLKEEWLEFKYEYLKIKAIEWCEYNNIKYTYKNQLLR